MLRRNRVTSKNITPSDEDALHFCDVSPYAPRTLHFCTIPAPQFRVISYFNHPALQHLINSVFDVSSPSPEPFTPSALRQSSSVPRFQVFTPSCLQHDDQRYRRADMKRHHENRRKSPGKQRGKAQKYLTRADSLRARHRIPKPLRRPSNQLI